jgi:hypothetical protein
MLTLNALVELLTEWGALMNTRKHRPNSCLVLSGFILGLVFFTAADARTPALTPADTVPLQPLSYKYGRLRVPWSIWESR